MSCEGSSSSPAEDEDTVPQRAPGYRPPPMRMLSQIVDLDQEDESLRKYKASLLGGVTGEVVIDEENPNDVIISKMEFLSDEKSGLFIDLTLPKDEIGQTNFVVKEGIPYQIRISFHVQRDIVTGLQYVHTIKRLGVKVDTETYMCGSFAPKPDVQEFTTPKHDMPSGVLAQGSYRVVSLFTDDDKNEILTWEWGLEIKSDWE